MIGKIALIAALCTTLPAAAQAPRWYAGAAGGQSRTSHELVSNRESTIVNASSVSSDFDPTDSAWKVFGGWQANDFLAIEASYADLGTSRLVTRTVSVDQLPGSIEVRRKITGFGLDAVLSAPIGQRFSVFGRAGAFRSRLVADASLEGGIVFTNGPADERSRSTTFDETVAHFGAGFGWSWRPDASVRVEWERFHDVGKAFRVGGTGTTGEADTDLVSAGVLVRF